MVVLDSIARTFPTGITGLNYRCKRKLFVLNRRVGVNAKLQLYDIIFNFNVFCVFTHYIVLIGHTSRGIGFGQSPLFAK